MWLDKLAKKYDLYCYRLGFYECYRFRDIPQSENAALIWINAQAFDRYSVATKLYIKDNCLVYWYEKNFFEEEELDEFIEKEIIPQYETMLKEYKQRFISSKLEAINGDFDDIQ